jgi:hypothetical protein
MSRFRAQLRNLWRDITFCPKVVWSSQRTLITSTYGPHRKHRFSIVGSLLVSWNEHCTVVILPRDRPAGNCAAVVMRYHGNATRYLAMGICHGFMNTALGHHVTIFFQLLIWFLHVNEMTEIVSGLPAPQYGEESSWVLGSELVQGSNGSCVSFQLICFRIPLRCLRTPWGTLVPQVEDRCSELRHHWNTLTEDNYFK